MNVEIKFIEIDEPDGLPTMVAELTVRRATIFTKGLHRETVKKNLCVKLTESLLDLVVSHKRENNYNREILRLLEKSCV